jgi:prevent-host-death family protein
MQLCKPHNLEKKEQGEVEMEKTVGAYEARRKFGQLLEEAFYNKDAFIVERAGRPMAAIVSIDEYHQWRELAKGQIFQMLEEVWSRNRTQTEPITPEEIQDEVDQALETLRQQLLVDKQQET